MLDNKIENVSNLEICLDLFVALKSFSNQAYTNVCHVIKKHFSERNKLFTHY